MTDALTRYVPRLLRDDGMIAASEVAHYTHLNLTQYVLASEHEAHDAAQRARIAELEQALRLHLAVSPDDPLLVVPVERELARCREALKRLYGAVEYVWTKGMIHITGSYDEEACEGLRQAKEQAQQALGGTKETP
jgi:hypothetical protein